MQMSEVMHMKAISFEQMDCFWEVCNHLRWLLGFVSAKIVLKLSWSGDH